MKVLNVAEKNDAAKNIAALLGRGNSTRREGLSVYNKIYEFNLRLFNQDCKMKMTSVSGHLLTYEFVGNSRKWHGCHPLNLFDAKVVKECPKNNMKIKNTLQREIRDCGILIIWTDCDREGENIGYEIIEVCKAAKPNIRVYRAKFSEITQTSIRRAIETLGEPNEAVSNAVDVRSELDLRIGAAFTRFQTLRLQKVFPRSLSDMLISYGSCQFPTLGFVVERFLAIEKFQSESYWKLRVHDDHDGIKVEFRWDRNRMFEERPCQVLLEMCLENPDATVEKVVGKPKSKWRPLPLDTIELEKQGSRKLRLNAKETMKVAEKLYRQGFISYPRTETNIFPQGLNLQSLVEQQTSNDSWGGFAQKILDEGLTPRQGKKSDQAHPPIHPTKCATGLQGNEMKVYEFVVRHFLACLSKNAEGHETVVSIDIAGETFVASGLRIIQKNYLDVYIYEKWYAKEIHRYEEGQIFRPTKIEMGEEQTSPPSLLTEADLIALMDKHGIGTDATHAEHIDTIKSREYVGLRDGLYFIPGKLGIGLVTGYDNMGFQMSKPDLRAELENDLKAICEGRKQPVDVLQSQIEKYKNVFQQALEKANMIDEALAQYLDEAPTQADALETVISANDPEVFKCPRCGSKMVLKERRNASGKYIGCENYPTCNNAVWLPQDVTNVNVLETMCSRCPGDFHKLKLKMKPGAFPGLGTAYTTCIGGCDRDFNEMMGIKNENLRRNDRGAESGYESTSRTTLTGSSTSGSRPTGSSGTWGIQETPRGRGPPQAGNHNRGIPRDIGGDRETRRNEASESSGKKWPAPSQQFQRGASSSRTPAHASGARVIENRENQSPTWGSLDDNSVILCDCHMKANLLTVSKEGPNKGRKFYKCFKARDAQCNFFVWADDGDSVQQAKDTDARVSLPRPSTSENRQVPPLPRPNPGSSAPADANPSCHCGQTAIQRTVRKEGPNKGRQFWGCPKGVEDSCNYFSWAVDPPPPPMEVDQGLEWNPPPSNRGRPGIQWGQGSTRAQRTGVRRKCGVCGVEGHTRRTCTQNSMD